VDWKHKRETLNIGVGIKKRVTTKKGEGCEGEDKILPAGEEERIVKKNDKRFLLPALEGVGGEGDAKREPENRVLISCEFGSGYNGTASQIQVPFLESYLGGSIHLGGGVWSLDITSDWQWYLLLIGIESDRRPA